MPKPICLKCNKEMDRVKNGIKIKIDENRAQKADKFECPECGATILSDYGEIYMDGAPEKYDLKHPRFNR